MAEREVVLSTVHGSHLYGLNHPGSDHDTFEVVLGPDKSLARQRTAGGNDRLVMHLHRFLQNVSTGVPQALEALWSPVATVNPAWVPMLSRLRTSTDLARATYRSTIVNFGYAHGGRTGTAAERVDTPKFRRHALRLAINLSDLMSTGRFNPRLTPEQVALITDLAGRPDYPDHLEHWLQTAQVGRPVHPDGPLPATIKEGAK